MLGRHEKLSFSEEVLSSINREDKLRSMGGSGINDIDQDVFNALGYFCNNSEVDALLQMQCSIF